MATRLFFTLALLALAACASPTPSASDPALARAVIDRAKGAVEEVAADPELAWLRANLRDAQAVLIIPSAARGGFIFGGSGGTGVLLAKGAPNEGWSHPAFYSMGSVTVGLQFGGEVSDIILIVMTKDAMDGLLGSSFRLGGDVSVAAGPVGAGAKGQIADIYAYSRSKGLYAGFNLEGAVLRVREDLNVAYYGAPVRPTDILIRRTAEHVSSDPLRQALAQTAR